MEFKIIEEEDFNFWLEMGLLLWPHYKKLKLKKTFEKLFNSKKDETFLCKKEKQNYIGFVNISLRNDYVSGSEHSPVGYIEGLFVKKEFRKKKIAKQLVSIAEEWAKSMGCKEVASDTVLENKKSQEFHKRIGFKKTETSVHFIKKIS